MAITINDFLFAGLALGLVIMITVLGILGGLRWLRGKNQTRLDALKEHVRGLKTRLGGLQDIYEEYRDQPLQPYRSAADTLHKQLQQARSDLLALNAAMDELERTHAVPDAPVNAAINVLPNSLVAQRMSQDIELAVADLTARMDEAFLSGQRLQHISDEMRQLEAQTEGYYEEMLNLPNRLKEAGVKGKVIDESEDYLSVLAYDLKRVPEHFKPGGAPEADTRKEQEGAAHVYELLGSEEAELLGRRKALLETDKLYHQMKAAEQHLGRNLQLMQKILSEPIPGLIVTRFVEQVMSVDDKFQAHAEKRAAPDAGDLKPQESELKRWSRVVQDCEQELSRARQNVDILRKVLKELDAAIEEGDTCLESVEAEQCAEYPVEWDLSRPLLEEIGTTRNQLGSLEKARTPEELTEGIQTANDLLAQIKVLLAKARQLLERHNHLLILLNRPEITGGLEWLRETGELAAHVDRYDEHNWDPRDDVKKFSRQIGALNELQTRLAPEDTQTALKESQLEERIHAMDLLLRRHLDLRPRAERIADRLETIVETEQQLRETLQQAAAVVGRTSLLLGNNAFLQETAGNQVSAFQSTLQSRLQALEHTKEGTLESKRVAASKDVERVQRSLNDWLARMLGGIDRFRDRLQGRLSRLDQIAILDDLEVNNARQLTRRLTGAPPVTSLLGFSEAATQLKRCSDDWVACETTERALTAKTGPVEESFEQASAALKEARLAFQNAGGLASGRREWSRVTQVSLENDRQSLDTLERRMSGLRTQRWPSVQLVRELDQLYHELDKLSDRVVQATRQAEQESRETGSVDEAYTSLKRYWEGRAQTEPALAAHIRNMLGRAEARYRSARDGYLRGSLNFEQTRAGVEEAADILEEGFTTYEGQHIKPS